MATTYPAAKVTSVPEEEPEVAVNPASSIDFHCDQCDYANASEKGLAQHKRMKHRISQVDGIIDTDEELTEDTTIVTLELDAAGDIIGPELVPNTSPPSKVFHPKAGLGIIQEELSSGYDGETFISYHFPDDPNAFVMNQGPNRGERMPSIMQVFLCPE